MGFMSLIEQLRDLDCFTASEREVIKVIFQNPDLLKTATAQELAKKAFTSTSTVVRLCQKLKYKTYNEFRLCFTAEWEQQRFGNAFIDASLPFRASDTPEQIIQQLTDLQCLALKETLSAIDMKTYQRVVDMLVQAESIGIYGTGINLHLAYDFAYKMARIHRCVHIGFDDQQQLLTSVGYYPGHCAIIISYSGESPNTVRYAKLLHDAKTPIISITSAGENSVAKYADERLQIAAMERQFSKIGAFASCTSITAIMNYLYAGIFARDYDKNYQLLLETVLRITEFRSNYGPLREDR